MCVNTNILKWFWWTVQDSVTHNFLLKICATPSQSPSLLPTFESCTRNPQRYFIQIASLYFHESWWTVQDSNLPPPHCKCGALPDELTALKHFVIKIFGRPFYTENGLAHNSDYLNILPYYFKRASLIT